MGDVGKYTEGHGVKAARFAGKKQRDSKGKIGNPESRKKTKRGVNETKRTSEFFREKIRGETIRGKGIRGGSSEKGVILSAPY